MNRREGVSYGGQLTTGSITQTSQFKAAIPIAHLQSDQLQLHDVLQQYEQMEFGVFPHQGNLMDVMWERSALKHVAKAHTPRCSCTARRQRRPDRRSEHITSR